MLGYPKSNDKRPYEWQKGESHVKREAEIRSDMATSQGSWQPQEVEEARTGLLPQNLQRKWNPANSLISVFWPPDCEIKNFCCDKPPGLWSFVTAALGSRNTLPVWSSWWSATHISNFPNQPRWSWALPVLGFPRLSQWLSHCPCCFYHCSYFSFCLSLVFSLAQWHNASILQGLPAEIPRPLSEETLDVSGPLLPLYLLTWVLKWD